MERMISALQQFMVDLAANPTVKIITQRIRHLDDCLKRQRDASYPYLADSRKWFEKEYGFAIPDDSLCMLTLTQDMTIAWAPAIPLEDYVQGEINLIRPSTALWSVKYQLEAVNADTGSMERQPLYYFDANSTLGGYDPATVYCYDRVTKHYAGLAVVLDKNQLVVPLPLSWGEYVALALTWHGAQGWPLLYLPLDEFLALDLYLRRSVYAFPRSLPRLFPQADWSILATKAAYFATEPRP